MRRARALPIDRRRPGGALRAGLIPLAALLALAACSGGARFRGEPVEPATPARLTGVNWDGEAFDLAGLEERVAVVFFGYTYCPDVCPMTLAKMKRLYGELGDGTAEDVAVVFVSVDPERDTGGKLAGYVPGFDRRFYGVRAEGLVAAKGSFGVTSSARAPTARGGEPGFYFVDHTGSIFLVDEARRLRVVHPAEAPVEDVAADVRALLAEELAEETREEPA